MREEGLTIDAAVAEIREEIKENDPVDQSANQREPSEKEELLKEQIDQLQSEVQYLRKKLDQKDERIQQLLPGKVEGGNGKAETDEFKEMSLVQVVKRWFTTKV